MSEVKLIDEGPRASSVVEFRRGVGDGVRIPRLQNLSSDQIDRLLRLLAMTEDLELLLVRAEKVMTACPVARSIVGK